MIRARTLSALHAVCIGVFVFVSPALAQHADLPGIVSEMPLPGGLRGALAAVDDRGAPDRSQFLLEFIRRSYDAPHGAKADERDAVLQALLAQLDRSSLPGAASDARETLPLPLTSALWIDAVFGGRATPETLASAILRSRNAALLYHGLLSIDDPTRAWLATQPQLLSDLASRHSAAFVAAAPGLRVSSAVVRVPGGERAEPAWQALVGRRVNEPADFVRALLAQADGRLAYFYGATAELPPDRIRLTLNLDAADPAVRIDAARRLSATFERIAPGWKVEERAFRRPSLDPALLAADLHADDGGRPLLPGTRRFWSAVFADADQGRARSSRVDDGAFAEGQPVDFAWLCEQVFKGDEAEQRRRYHLVLFASRVVGRVTPDNARDAIDAVRAAAAYPALVAVLERARLADVAAFARAARRAAQVSSIGDELRALRALEQFQGALALVTRAALQGSVPVDSLPAVVTSLSAVELSERGEYEGRLVQWLDGWIAGAVAAQRRNRPTQTSSAPAASGPSRRDAHDGADKEDGRGDEPDEPGFSMDHDLFRILAGPTAVEPRFVDWEGTRYRVDLAWAESTRLARLLGEHPRPYLSSARALVAIADALAEDRLTRETVRREADAFGRVEQALAWQRADASSSVPGWEGTGVPVRYREVSAALGRAARAADVRAASRLAPALRLLGDDLLARGLLELVYAVALGQADRVSVSAADVAGRHDFGLRPVGIGPADPWQLPTASAGTPRGWRVTGSLLGLDVRLAEFSLVRISTKPPSKKPTLNDGDRHVLVEAVALVRSTSLTEADRDAVVGAIRKGREKLAAVRTPAEAAALAGEMGLSPARRTLLPWVVAYDPARLGAFLSPSELFWLGLDTKPVDPRLDAWGAPGEPRLGCLCLQLLDRRPWETLAGRRNSGILASGFPDLNFRLAELLTELQMPARLLGPVLGAATLDLINTVSSRDPDDHRGLVEFVQSLRRERVEEYLALLTTDGPLVPISEGSQPGAAGGKTGAPR